MNLSSQNALVISLALSGLKLKKITESFSFTTDKGFPFSVITVGTTNSSVTFSAYEASIAATALSACFPSPVVSER